jgi:hypothetical protein
MKGDPTTRREGFEGTRGQTIQDFALGISVFVLTVAVAVSMFPSFTTPFQSSLVGDNAAQADRVGRTLVMNLSEPGTVNQLNVTELESVMDADEAGLLDRYGLSNRTNINLTVQTADGSAFVTDSNGVTLTSEPQYRGQPAATTVRIVTLSDGSCGAGCRLVIRVW